jgi:hypothetical protein
VSEYSGNWRLIWKKKISNGLGFPSALACCRVEKADRAWSLEAVLEPVGRGAKSLEM